MKSLLVPAAIAIGGLFVVSHLDRTDSQKVVCATISKNDHARHTSHLQKNDVFSSFNEVPANAIQVVNFAPLTEIAASSFLIDFSDAQTEISDMEMNDQMKENLAEIRLPGTELADFEISHQMKLNLVEISMPDTKEADAEINENFPVK